MSKSREQLIDFIKEIDVTDKTVLDVGAGPKEKWAINLFKGIPKKYITTDIVKGFGVEVEFDLNRPQPIEFIKQQGLESDIVFCIETLEHVWNPVQAMENLSMFTKETLYISTPFINPIHDTWDYLRYTFQWYEKVLKMFEFKKIEIYPRTATGRNIDCEVPLPTVALEDFYNAEGMRMSKVTQKMGYGDHLLDIGYFVRASK